MVEAEESPITEIPAIEEPSMPIEKYKFDAVFQTKIAALATRDTAFMQRTDGLIRPEYFEAMPEAMLVNLSVEYFGRYKKVPADLSIYTTLLREAIENKAMTREQAGLAGHHLKKLFSTDVSDRDFVIDQVAEFARHQAVADAMFKAVTCLDRKDFGKIEKLMKSALDVGAHIDGDAYDFGEMLDRRTAERIERAAGKLPPTGITTGYPALDECLYHGGWGRKELSVLMGGPKSGKTTALIDFGISAMGAGKNVLYVTLEVSAEIIAERMDANISDTAVRELGASVHAVRERVRKFSEGARAPRYPGEKVPKAGKFLIHEFPSGTMTISDLRRLIERYKGQGVIFDLVVVDYADLMSPDRYTDDAIENSRNVYVNLRGLAMQEQFAVLTATQTNREGAKAAVAKMDHVASDFNKIRIADIVISINRTDEERAANQARLFFAASRNQEGNFTLRIEQALDKMKFLTKVLGSE